MPASFTVPLEKASPGLEIINCGMGGYESWRLSKVFHEILRYQPDMVVLLSGNNEGLEEPCPGDFAAEARLLARRLRERFYSIFRRGRSARTEASLAIHESRVRAMAAAARRAGVPLVICALPSNLLMPPQAAPPENSGFAMGLAAFERKDFKAALERFLPAAQSGSSVSAYYAGRSLYSLGRSSEAAVYLGLAVDLAPLQERAGPARNAILREAAGKETACLADLDAAFRKASPGGVPGFDQFTDGVHWLPAYNNIAWETIFSAAGGCGIKAAAAYGGAGQGLAEAAPDIPRRRLSYAVSWLSGAELEERSVAMLGYLLKTSPEFVNKTVLSPDELEKALIRNFWSPGPVISSGAAHSAFVFHAAEAYRRSGRLETALELAESLSSKGYSNWRLEVMKAKTLSALGRNGKAETALRALAAVPGGGKAAFDLGSALGLDVPAPCADNTLREHKKSKQFSDGGAAFMAKGDFMAARKAFSAAVAADPDNSGALLSLCLLNRRLGKAEAALDHCRRAAEAALNCGEQGSGGRALAAEAFLQTGRAYLDYGRRAEASPALKKALASAPPGWERAEETRALLRALKK